MGFEKIKLPEDESVQQALSDLRDKAKSGNWFVVFSYSNKNTLQVVAQGEGGLTDAQQHFTPKEGAYALLRKDHKVELANTTKFAYIGWCPDTASPMRKALLSTHKGQVKDLLKPYHVDMEGNDLGDLDENIIMDKIGFSSGTKVHVTDKAVYSNKPTAHQQGSTVGQTKLQDHVPKSVTRNAELKVEDEDSVKAAMAAVRSDSDPTDWMLVTYASKNALKLQAQGQGGVSEMCENLSDTEVFYGIFRVTEKVDLSVTVKFGFVKLMSPKLPPLRKAAISTHRGFVTKLFEPFHVEFSVDAKEDFSEDIAMEKIGSYSGTKSKVTSKTESVLESQKTSHKKTTHLVAVDHGAGVALSFEDEDALRQAIKDVRNDANDTTWLVSKFDKNKLGLVATGTGDLDELMSSLEEKSGCFAFFRVTDQIDKSTTVKFVYIRYQPPDLAPMRKSAISTKKGLIDRVFEPVHVDFFIEAKSEITMQEVQDKVGAASGSKSNILAKKE